MKNYEVKITADHSKFDLNLKETAQYKDLIKLFIKKNFALIYKQTILGPLWLILNPLFSSIIYTFVFGKMVGLSTDGVPAFLFYLTGTALWNMFTNTLSGTSVTFMSNVGVFGKVYFPRLTIPISQAITGIMKFLIQFAMLVCFYLFYLTKGVSLFNGWWILLVPLLVIQTALMAMACGIIVSSVTIKYRDLSLAIGLIIQMWMYITPVIYPVSYLKGWMYTVIMCNPMTPIINNFRFCMLGTGEFMGVTWLYSMVVTFVLVFLGVSFFNKTEKTFVDVI